MCQPHAPQRVRADRFTKRAIFRRGGVHFAENSPFIGGAGDDLPCDSIEMSCFQIAQEGMSVRCLKRAPVIFIGESVIGLEAGDPLCGVIQPKAILIQLRREFTVDIRR